MTFKSRTLIKISEHIKIIIIKTKHKSKLKAVPSIGVEDSLGRDLAALEKLGVQRNLRGHVVLGGPLLLHVEACHALKIPAVYRKTNRCCG